MQMILEASSGEDSLNVAGLHNFQISTQTGLNLSCTVGAGMLRSTKTLSQASSIYILVDEEYDITLASYGSGTGTQTRIESDCGNFQGAIAQGII